MWFSLNDQPEQELSALLPGEYTGAVDAFALGKNVLLFQQLYQLRYIEQVFFVGLLFQNTQKRCV